MMPLFNVNLPANAAECFGFIMTLASFNLLPMNIFYNAYLGIASDDPGPVNQNFNALGYSSIFFLYNMGTLLLGIAAIPMLVILSALGT